MDEKELIKDIRWKFSKGKSRAEITRNLQKKGLKLEFIDSLIYRAERPRKILKISVISIASLIFIWFGIYGMFFYHTTEKVQYSPNWIKQEGFDEMEYPQEEFSLEITPELISLIASEIGVGKLRTSPLTLKKPSINFKISEDLFHTRIGKKIETERGNGNEADLLFSTDRETVEEIFFQKDIKEGIRNAVISGEISIEQLASEQELFLKGYLGLYNELK